ncbi:hypothetical protein AVEN_78118-1 [Araneus ventricosus]|uniref:Uncharacterized protein n=1 Tax=Araneus ventricosus TaxID=182803 RepID=A0A4Y2KW78_ARAVE|nr:hypothetical protein AVEN_78118-1 [Araneus ventricosus]
MPLQFHERKVPIKQFSSREVRAEVGVAGKCQLLFNSSTSSDGWRAMSSDLTQICPLGPVVPLTCVGGFSISPVAYLALHPFWVGWATENCLFFIAHQRDPLWHDPCKSHKNIGPPRHHPPSSPTKKRQLPDLETPSLGTYLGAIRDLYVQSHLQER